MVILVSCQVYRAHLLNRSGLIFLTTITTMITASAMMATIPSVIPTILPTSALLLIGAGLRLVLGGRVEFDGPGCGVSVLYVECIQHY